MFTFSLLSFDHHLVYSCHLYRTYVHTNSDTMYIYLHVRMYIAVNYVYSMYVYKRVNIRTCMHGLYTNILYFSLYLFVFKVKLIMVKPGNTLNMQ